MFKTQSSGFQTFRVGNQTQLCFATSFEAGRFSFPGTDSKRADLKLLFGHITTYVMRFPVAHCGLPGVPDSIMRFL